MDRQPSTKVVLFTSLISLLHALANPPLYGWMSQRYRRGYLFVFKMALSICAGQRPKRRSSLSKFWPPISRGKMLASPFHEYTFCFLIITLIPRKKWWIRVLAGARIKQRKEHWAGTGRMQKLRFMNAASVPLQLCQRCRDQKQGTHFDTNNQKKKRWLRMPTAV